MLSTRRLLAGGLGSRAFKTKSTERAKQAASNAANAKMQGKDPFGVFKSALVSEPDKKAKSEVRMQRDEWEEKRKAYSRAKMLERHRVDKHFQQMCRMRDAAIAALPDELREEARHPDLTVLPIERRVFTETAPIPDFQLKLQQRQ